MAGVTNGLTAIIRIPFRVFLFTEQMAKTSSYQEKLLDPKWQKKRLEIFNRDKWACVCCNRTEVTLHVHHLFYFPGTEPWDYKDEHLVTYCEYCHNSEHLIGNLIDDALMDIIKNNTVFIKPLAQLCILTEKHPPFIDNLKTFLNLELVSYLESRKSTKNG